MQKVLRSLIHEKFPEDLRLEISKLSKRRDLLNDEKQDELFNILRQYDLGDITPLGPGTNRYAFKIDGFVVKFATNRDGVIDNYKEFKMAKRLYPDVTKIYEVSENGTLLVAEYIQPFQSYAEMYQYADKIRAILTKLSAVYLIGDVGITAKNYANWGLRVGSDEPVCLDFAYVYNISSELFVCRKCKNNAMLYPDKDFVKLICPARGCGAVYEFTDIRRRIGNDIHKHEIGDLSEEGYVMEDSNVITELTPERSNYLQSKKVEETVEETEEEILLDDFELDEPLYNYMSKKEGKDMNTVGPIFRLKANAVPKAAKEESPETVAFSGEMDDEPIVIKAVPVLKKPAIEEPVEIPEDDQDKLPEEYTKEEKATRGFSDKFINAAHYAVSNITKFVQETMMRGLFFDTVKNDIMEKKMYPADFYKILTTAIYKAIVGYCQFEQIEIPNSGDTPGTHRGFKAPTTIVGTEFEPTMIFLERVFIDDNIRHLDNIEDVMNKYREIYEDSLGIQREVLPLFKAEFTKRIRMTDAGYEKVLSTVDSMIFVPVEIDDIRIVATAMADAEKEGLNYDLKARLDAEIAADKVESDEDLDINKILAGAANEAIKEAEESLDEIAFSDDVDTSTDDDQEEENKYIATTVEVFHEDDTDIIRLKTGDAFGEVCIPFYEKLSDVDVKKIFPSMADDRNGCYDWLIHITPLMMFETNDPDHWLEYNDDEMHEEFIHPLILDSTKENTVMGVWMIDGMYEYDEDGTAHLITDDELVWKINKVILDGISTTSLSHFGRTIERTDLILSEDEIKSYFVIEDDDDDTSITAQEDAAIKALLGAEPTPIIDAEEVKDETVETEVSSDEETLIFNPIRKPRS